MLCSILLIFISLVPVVALGLYIYKRDSVKEPKSLLTGLFFSGLFAAFLVIVINIFMILFLPEFYLSDNYARFGLLRLFLLIFVEVALVEEFCKWIMIRCIGYNHKDFDQLYDIIVYSVFVALGFAAVENIFYVMQGGVSLGIYRAIFSVPGHVSFGIFMGYFLGLAKLWQKKSKAQYRFYMFLSVFVPALLHTIYNFCLMAEVFWYLIIFVGFIIILYVSALKEVDKFSKSDELIE